MRSAENKGNRLFADGRGEIETEGLVTSFQSVSLQPTTEALKRKSIIPTKKEH